MAMLVCQVYMKESEVGKPSPAVFRRKDDEETSDVHRARLEALYHPSRAFCDPTASPLEP
jgi:hypothetical protein